jgi:argininosuccinate synthase
MIDGRESPSSLYNQKLSSMDIEGGFNQQDSEGFIKINAIRLMAHNAITEIRQKERTTGFSLKHQTKKHTVL